MKLEVGTLQELNVKPGDVVEWIEYESVGHLRAEYISDGYMIFKSGSGQPYVFGSRDTFRIISRATTRAHILDTAKQYVTQDRQNTHGKPEDTFGLIAQLWGAYLGRAIAPVEVCAMMALLKIARSADNPTNADNWIDLAGYAACAGGLAK